MTGLADLLESAPSSRVPPVPRSRGVIACNGAGVGCVLWYAPGSTLEHELHECSQALDDLGLDDAPRGISIWEGAYIWHPGTWDNPDDGHTEPVGAFRVPTDDEWAAIRAGRNPFPDERTVEQRALDEADEEP